MDPPPRPSSSLFDVYLRLRPSNPNSPRFLSVEKPDAAHPTHIAIKPPTNDNRKRAIERFAFTRVFEEDARQMDLFKGTGILPMIESVLGAPGHQGRDGLLATLGVTGSGKVSRRTARPHTTSILTPTRATPSSAQSPSAAWSRWP